MMNKKFLSVAEAAEQLGVSRATMYRYLQDKTIPAVKLGGNTWKISAKYLENLESEDKKIEPSCYDAGEAQ
ncbi:MAG: helix-turn-helix transcriptional regulator [Oscillospiraceae bacterium]